MGEKFDHLDALINNAGVFPEFAAGHLSPSQLSLDDFQRTYTTNVFGAFSVLKAFLPLLQKSPAPRVVNVSSTLGSLTTLSDPQSPYYGVNTLAYNLSKAALNMMTVHGAWQWKNSAHKANAVHPGNVQAASNPFGGGIRVEEGAKTSVEMATIGSDGPNGTFSHLGQPLPW